MPSNPLLDLTRHLGRLQAEVERLRAREQPRWVLLAAPVKVWDGIAQATGTYAIDTSASGLPAGVRAVLVYYAGTWLLAANTSHLTLRPKGSGDVACGVSALVAAYNVRGQGIVPCDSAGDFDAVIAGANSTAAWLHIWGYLL